MSAGLKTLRARISKRAVDSAPIPGTGENRVWDTDIKGFVLRVYPSGRKVYAVKCRMGTRQHLHTIGGHGSPWTPVEARKAATEVIRLARSGHDPSAGRKAARVALSVAGLIDRYLAEGPFSKPNKRASSWGTDASNLNRHIRPLLGRKVADALTKAEAARAIRDIVEGKTKLDEKTRPRGRARVRGGEGTARRTRNTVAAMFAWGIDQELCAQNPFVDIRLGNGATRERFLTNQEAVRFFDAMGELESCGSLSNTFADALRLLLFTGARKTEILGLKWSEIDWPRKRIVLRPERTKAGGKTGERRVTLSPPALELLLLRRAAAERRAAQEINGDDGGTGDFVFPAVRGEGHAIGLRRAFVRVCCRANLLGLRVHDLRHSFASFAIADGASLFLVGKLLGHTSARTTERYAHLSDDPLQEAAARVGARIMASDQTDKRF